MNGFAEPLVAAAEQQAPTPGTHDAAGRLLPFAWPLPPESDEFLSAETLKGVDTTGGGSDTTAAYFVRVHIVILTLSQAPKIVASLGEQNCYVDTIHA